MFGHKLTRTAGAGASWNHVFLLIAVFVGLFSLSNSIELPLDWKDRREQVRTYLAATFALGDKWVMPALWGQKVIEGLLGVLALAGLLRRHIQWVVASIAGWMVVMTVFAFMDVWAADRAELQEHTVYFGIFALLLTVIIVLQGMTAAEERVERAVTALERQPGAPERRSHASGVAGRDEHGEG